MKKFYFILLLVLGTYFTGIGQSADPDVNINMVPPIMPLNIVGKLNVSTCNNGDRNIVANSLKITVSVGTNAEILSLDPTSDARWTVLSLSTGNNNTIILKNTGGTLTSITGANPCANIKLNVKAKVNGGPQTITGNISYIAGANPLLTANAPSSSQGNSSTANDNSTTSLLVQGGALPVKLTAFNAVVNNCVTTLSWKSSTEVNFSNYMVEYSKDGINFTTISSVNGQGDNSSYTITQRPDQGKAYYRLKMMDIDSKVEYSRIIALDINCSKGTVLVYPNPTHDVININITGADKNGTKAILFNQSGQAVLNEKLQNGSNQINVNRLTPGIYQLKLVNNTGTENIKVVIE